MKRILAMASLFAMAAVSASAAASHEAWDFQYGNNSDPEQIPLCMIGDSITWADNGDCWRKFMLEKLPRLAFVGTHSASFGYSHCGEGGNNTRQVLRRMNNIPDCPYYLLHIGTNNNDALPKGAPRNKILGAPTEEELTKYILPCAEATAEDVVRIVNELLKKKGVKKVFLCSILPCYRPTSFRNRTNFETNRILRTKLSGFPEGKVVWVELEKPVLEIPDWERVIKLHPLKPGYEVIAAVTADAIIKALNIDDPAKAPVAKGKVGVRVFNLLDAEKMQTKMMLRCGYYTISGTVKKVGKNPGLRLINSVRYAPFDKTFPVNVKEGERFEFEFFTGNPSRVGQSVYKMELVDFEADQLMIEKKRPSGKASPYTPGLLIDTTSVPALGEVWEKIGQ